MSINFVSTTVLTSADGIHKEQRILESESPKGGLAVRNRDEEKLKAREGTNLTLYEQLQQNKEDKDVDWESQLRESRMPKALDDEEVAFLEEQDAKRTRALRQHEKQELDDVAEFRAARIAFEASSNTNTTTGNSTSSSSSSSSSSLSSLTSSSTKAITAVSSMPRVTLKRKRRQPIAENSKDPTSSTATTNGVTKRTKSNDEAGSNSSLAMIANYASSSDDDE
jgi:hypothetical protein